MNNICKQYIKNVKAFFPAFGKNEKRYLKNFKLNVEEYFEENPICSLEELYQNFGSPSEVINTYYAHVDINYILKQIKRTKAIKAFILSLIIFALISVSVYCISLYSEYETFKNQEIFFEETFIE